MHKQSPDLKCDYSGSCSLNDKPITSKRLRNKGNQNKKYDLDTIFFLIEEKKYELKTACLMS